jgi:hypothetical protein
MVYNYTYYNIPKGTKHGALVITFVYKLAITLSNYPFNRTIHYMVAYVKGSPNLRQLEIERTWKMNREEHRSSVGAVSRHLPQGNLSRYGGPG